MLYSDHGCMKPVLLQGHCDNYAIDTDTSFIIHHVTINTITLCICTEPYEQCLKRGKETT